MAKKPHSEVRWVTKYTIGIDKFCFGSMLALGRDGLPIPSNGTPTRVRVIDYPAPKRKGKKRGK